MDVGNKTMLFPSKSRLNSDQSPVSSVKTNHSLSEIFDSAASIRTTGSDKRQTKTAAEASTEPQKNNKGIAKTLGVIIIPLVALTVVSGISLASTVSRLRDSNANFKVIEASDRVSALFLALQVERSLTVAHVSRNRVGFASLRILWERRSVTDLAVQNLETLPPLNVSGELHTTKDEFFTVLNEYRERVDGVDSQLHIAKVITFYTDINVQILDEVLRLDADLKDGTLWPNIVCKGGLLRLSDLFGIQKALGSSFFAGCSLTSQNLAQFRNIESSIEIRMRTVFSYCKEAGLKYEELVRSNDPTEAQVIVMQEYIVEGGNPCENFGQEESSRLSTFWFDNMSVFTGIFEEVIDGESESIREGINAIISEAFNDFAAKVTILLLTTGLSLSLGIVQLIQARRLMSKIGQFARSLSKRSKELIKEKRITEDVLLQMMPRSVALQVRQKKDLIAEEFANVTIYFSDIVEFTGLSARSTPMQVVTLLNELYGTFDNCIERYDVYKVETIGDAYMVASGVPMPTDRHAYEIACMALDLLQEIRAFNIPHLQDETLSLRVGIHSGSCVAGVAGSKMPRYCLFGDTVNIASKMESTGEAERIHISESTRNELIGKHHAYKKKFTIIPRDGLAFQGKGNIQTYWLTGEAAREVVNVTSCTKRIVVSPAPIY